MALSHRFSSIITSSSLSFVKSTKQPKTQHRIKSPLPADVVNGVVTQVLERRHQLVLGFLGTVTAVAVLIGDSDSDAARTGVVVAPSRGQGVFVELADDGGGADEKVAQ